jgi:hemerythrin-like metal-binding protein
VFNKSNLGRLRVQEQHQELEKLLSGIRDASKLKDYDDFKMLFEKLYSYFIYHLEYENSIMRLHNTPDELHIQSHNELLTEVAEFACAYKEIYRDSDEFVDHMDKWRFSHVNEHDTKINQDSILDDNHVLKPERHTGCVQIVFYENGYYAIAYGVMSLQLLNSFTQIVDTENESLYHDKEKWFGILDLSKWDYATKDGYESVSVSADGDMYQKRNLYFITAGNQITEFITNQILKFDNTWPRLKNIFELVDALNFIELKFGKVIKTMTIGDFYYIDQYYFKGD